MIIIKFIESKVSTGPVFPIKSYKAYIWKMVL